MEVKHPIYEDGEIAAVLWATDTTSAERNLWHLAIRYLCPQDYLRKDGSTVGVSNMTGGETEWFVVPHSFGVAIAKSLIEQKAAGLSGFSEDGFTRMVEWLIEMSEISDAMCY
jgi:hypothetical protein